jgi:hypothetical protein
MRGREATEGKRKQKRRKTIAVHGAVDKSTLAET